MGLAGPGQRHRVVGHQVAVDGRRERQPARCGRRDMVEDVGRGVDQRLDGSAVSLPGGHAQPVEHQLRHPVRPAALVDRGGRRALGDRAGEQAGGRWHGQQCGHDTGARGLAEHGHPVGVAAEAGDVVANPPQCREHVAQGDVAVELFPERGEVDEAERAEPVVDGDDDDVGGGGQHGTVVERLAARAEDVGPAVQPHHHRPGVARRGPRRRPDVEEQAVLVGAGAQTHRDRAARLRADRPEAGGVEDLGPRLRRLRRAPAQVTDRGGGVAECPSRS